MLYWKKCILFKSRSLKLSILMGLRGILDICWNIFSLSQRMIHKDTQTGGKIKLYIIIQAQSLMVLYLQTKTFLQALNIHGLYKKWNYHVNQVKIIFCFVQIFANSWLSFQKFASRWPFHSDLLSHQHQGLAFTAVILSHSTFRWWLLVVFPRMENPSYLPTNTFFLIAFFHFSFYDS